jgi:hypothetical protein
MESLETFTVPLCNLMPGRSFVWRNLSHLTEINIGGNYARKQQKCETVISDVAGRLEWGGRGNVYVISREC